MKKQNTCVRSQILGRGWEFGD